MSIERAEMKYTDITLHDAGFENPRKHFDKTSLKELADSIADEGLRDPIDIWETEFEGKKKRILIAGERRYRAIGMLIEDKRANGLQEKVPVNIYKGKTLLDAMILAMEENVQRENLTSFELAAYMAQLEKMGLQQKDMAARLHKSQSWVSRTLNAFRTATPELKKAWKAQEVPDDMVQVLAKLPPDKQDAEVAKVVETRQQGRAGKMAARSQVKAKSGKKAPPPRENPPLKEVKEFRELLGEPPKKNRYLQGLLHGVEFALGQRGWAEFDEDYKSYVKTKLAAEKEEKKEEKKDKEKAKK